MVVSVPQVNKPVEFWNIGAKVLSLPFSAVKLLVVNEEQIYAN